MEKQRAIIQEAYAPRPTADELLKLIEGTNGEACRKIMEEYRELFCVAPGSSVNHQAWFGGYMDHVAEVLNIGTELFDTLDSLRPLPFSKSDTLLVLFLHDLEKPFKYQVDEHGQLQDNPKLATKEARKAQREEVMQAFGIHLDSAQANALHYVEGIRDAEYTNTRRLMGELAAFCHCVDTLSARMWYNFPLTDDDPWHGAQRVNPSAAGVTLKSEIYK